MRVLAGVLFLCGLFAMASLSSAQPPGGGKGGQGGKGGFGKAGQGKGGFGGGAFAPPQPGQIMPAPLAERLKLTDDQRKQLHSLQKDVDEKLAKILTDDQNKQLKELKERRPGVFGGGDGKGGGGFGGGKGKGKGDPPPPE